MRKLLAADAVADWFGIPKLRVYELARAGILPGVVRLGRQVRFDPAALERFIEAGGVETPGVRVDGEGDDDAGTDRAA